MAGTRAELLSLVEAYRACECAPGTRFLSMEALRDEAVPSLVGALIDDPRRPHRAKRSTAAPRWTTQQSAVQIKPRCLLGILSLVGCNATATAQTGPINVTGAPNATTSAHVEGNTASAEGARPSTSITVPVAVAPNSNAAVGSIATTPAAPPSVDAGADASR